MMFHYPYYGFPFYRRNPYRYSYPNYSRFPYNNRHPNNYSTYQQESQAAHYEKTAVEKEKIHCSEDTKQEENSPFFEIFGIKLYFDDILLICLIFFLYKEGVQDQSLFISLILLLLS